MKISGAVMGILTLKFWNVNMEKADLVVDGTGSFFFLRCHSEPSRGIHYSIDPSTPATPSLRMTALRVVT